MADTDSPCPNCLRTRCAQSCVNFKPIDYAAERDLFRRETATCSDEPMPESLRGVTIIPRSEVPPMEIKPTSADTDSLDLDTLEQFYKRVVTFNDQRDSAINQVRALISYARSLESQLAESQRENERLRKELGYEREYTADLLVELADVSRRRRP